MVASSCAEGLNLTPTTYEEPDCGQPIAAIAAQRHIDGAKVEDE
jgi:hypothetical protein